MQRSEKRGGIQEKSKSCTGATKTECKRAIDPDISDEVPALAYIKKRKRGLNLWTRLKLQL